jgi:hypothetical protein
MQHASRIEPATCIEPLLHLLDARPLTLAPRRWGVARRSLPLEQVSRLHAITPAAQLSVSVTPCGARTRARAVRVVMTLTVADGSSNESVTTYVGHKLPVRTLARIVRVHLAQMAR